MSHLDYAPETTVRIALLIAQRVAHHNTTPQVVAALAATNDWLNGATTDLSGHHSVLKAIYSGGTKNPTPEWAVGRAAWGAIGCALLAASDPIDRVSMLRSLNFCRMYAEMVPVYGLPAPTENDYLYGPEYEARVKPSKRVLDLEKTREAACKAERASHDEIIRELTSALKAPGAF